MVISDQRHKIKHFIFTSYLLAHVNPVTFLRGQIVLLCQPCCTKILEHLHDHALVQHVLINILRQHILINILIQHVFMSILVQHILINI